MKSLNEEINLCLNRLARENEVTKSDLISATITIIEEEYGSMSLMTPSDRFELIIAKIVMVFEDEKLDSLYTALTNEGPLLRGTKALDTNIGLAS